MIFDATTQQWKANGIIFDKDDFLNNRVTQIDIFGNDMLNNGPENLMTSVCASSGLLWNLPEINTCMKLVNSDFKENQAYLNNDDTNFMKWNSSMTIVNFDKPTRPCEISDDF